MGIYLFNRELLVSALRQSSFQDFGREVFPSLIEPKRVRVHLFDGYWEDIGTIGAFFKANLALASENPPFDLMSPEAPIYSRARFLPPTRIDGARIESSLIADGCRISQGATIINSVIGLRCTIGPNVTIRNSILMGADEYQTRADLRDDRRFDRPPVGIGADSQIINAIVDKNVRIGRGVHIDPPPEAMEFSEVPGCSIRDGLTVVAKETVLHDGWRWPGR
jgi:glucose-1-phosphate adenylyltransferase